MFTEEDGDSLVGRTTAMLKMDADEFDILPCHFGTETERELYEYGWHNILPDYNNLPPSTKRCIPKLFASIVYHFHKGDMGNVLPWRDHPIYMQDIFTDRTLINSLRDKVIFKYSYCSDTRMTAQGIPGFIIISRELRNFREYFDRMHRENNNAINELQAVMGERLDKLPQDIVNLLLEEVQIGGAAPITLDSIRRIISEMLVVENGPLSQIQSSINRLSEQQNNFFNNNNVGLNNNNNNNNRGIIVGNGGNLFPRNINNNSTLHLWESDLNARYHYVPSGFIWPSYNASIMWTLWYFGDNSKNIGPFKRISREYDLVNNHCKVNFSKAKSIINKLMSIAINGAIINNEAHITRENSQRILEYSLPLLIQRLYPYEHERPTDLNIYTLWNRASKLNNNNNNNNRRIVRRRLN